MQLSLISDFFYVIEQQLISATVVMAAFCGNATKDYGPMGSIR